MDKNIDIMILSLIIFLCLFAQSNARVLYVHPESTLNKIQTGLNSAYAGDTVLVAPGVYAETLNWPSRNGIKLISEFGPQTTIINAGIAQRSAIRIPQYITSTTLIDGFTIMNGWAVPPNNNGGGICCTNAGLTIRNNIITNNGATSNGGGIYLTGNYNTIIMGNKIINNSATDGGGVACSDNSSSTLITENLFNTNNAGDGSAIFCYQSSPSIHSNQIIQNYASSAALLACGTAGSHPQAKFNNFISNTINDAATDYYASIYAKHCWWGDTFLPGNHISGNVTYTPFYRQKIIFDISALSIVAPSDTVHLGSTCIPKIIVKNCGNNDSCPVLFFTARCSIGTYHDYQRVSCYLKRDSTIEVRFKPWMLQDTGVYLMKVRVYYAVDCESLNDTISKRIIVRQPAIEEEKFIQKSPNFYALSNNFPNPFLSRTTIKYAIPCNCHIELRIYNSFGTLIRTLESGFKKVGYYEINWNGCDNKGKKVPGGVYFCRLEAKEFTATKKMTILR